MPTKIIGIQISVTHSKLWRLCDGPDIETLKIDLCLDELLLDPLLDLQSLGAFGIDHFGIEACIKGKVTLDQKEGGFFILSDFD